MELNAMEPVMAQCCFESAAIMMNGFDTLRINCVDGITANPEQCREYIHKSFGVVTALNPVIGYKNSTKIAKEAMIARQAADNRHRDHAALRNALRSSSGFFTLFKHHRFLTFFLS